MLPSSLGCIHASIVPVVAYLSMVVPPVFPALGILELDVTLACTANMLILAIPAKLGLRSPSYLLNFIHTAALAGLLMYVL